MFAKICGLREARHVTAAIDAGADAVGFVLTASPRFVTASEARELVGIADARALTVGVFRHETVDEVARLADASGVAAIQVHGKRTRAEMSKLEQIGRTLIRAVPFDDPSLEEDWGENLLLVDAPRPGSGEAWDYAAMSGLSEARGRWLLAGGLTAGNVAAAVTAAKPYGVDVSSGVETAPGVKSTELIRAFLAAAKA
ncbi:phosphoribosylanthranilate isomerase [Homoserinimonas aerilata]|uniref:N-(5'-phosphoribosyl)anthranilate isomerase n=1 Tax=Homoserinimonas aerilata TaxID=1162970 RepID=A0A542YG10_9MICO|nr:phosphoribosylanthranilate isomerase [Homoserinimonas aerilata]TQL47009.1 phosphoribosylanthranilate isomerase [Homoserinimonas aerilata]